ncbi:flippase-like domain-containing protein [Pseudomonas sp. LS1212]|uniref:lysylphosphatidylglycerol synthase transmembrane domain-containing protein n=1 Tax=Pseudomonas sp. LS1212 TaxID=2972478 RepID=UPI00215C6917|nr:lysylphosphatidylglycerol synthase transmembrane domain-containing protein [Pseudomonas sp. LS1212]UVJ43170.1 flippase-like domain-containing protein [Pseudomonas sp. LS1212]
MSRIAWLLFALLAAVLIPLLLGGREMLVRLQAYPLPMLMQLFAMIGACWVINAARLRLLLGDQVSRLSRLKSFAVILATEFAICATPGGSGGPLTLMATLGRSGIQPARSSAVFAMDQLSDLVFFFCALLGILLYALFQNLDDYLEWMLVVSALLVLVGLSLCLGLARFHRQLLRINGRLLSRLNVQPATRLRWARKLLLFLAAFADTCKLPWRTLAGVFLLTCLHWGLRYSVLYLALRGLGVDLQWAWSFLIQMLSLSAGQFSLLPGGAGAAELTSAALLAPMVGKSTAAAAILIWRAVTYYFYLIAGGPVFLLMVGRPLLRKFMRLKQA